MIWYVMLVTSKGLINSFNIIFDSETNQKFRNLKKQVQPVLVHSLEKAIWNWMDTYPEEFTELQKKPNDDLTGKCYHLTSAALG